MAKFLCFHTIETHSISQIVPDAEGSRFLPEGLVVWGPYTNPCVCVRASVRASVRPSGLFLITFLIEKTHESTAFGPETGSETGPKVTKCVRT